MYYALINCGKEINSKDLLSMYDILPIDYLVFKKNDKKNTLSFDFHNNVFQLAVKNYISFSIQNQMISSFIKDFPTNRITYGIFEEKLLILFLSYNKIQLNDLNFQDSNRLEVEEIYNFNSSLYLKTNQKIDYNKSIIICQKNYIGHLYDLLILVSTEFNSYNAYFIQIGTNKLKTQIDIAKDDIKNNNINYKNGIEKFIDYKINKIELIFIFDKDTQINLIKDQKFSGAQYCYLNDIAYFLFSTQDYLLYKGSDMEIFNNINFFENTRKYPKRSFYEKLKQEINAAFTEIEIKAINEIINDDIEQFDIQIPKGKIKGIPNQNDLEYNDLYLLENKDKRFYIIHKTTYYFEKDKLVKLEKRSNVNKNEEFFLFIFSRNRIKVNPILKII